MWLLGVNWGQPLRMKQTFLIYKQHWNPLILCSQLLFLWRLLLQAINYSSDLPWNKFSLKHLPAKILKRQARCMLSFFFTLSPVQSFSLYKNKVDCIATDLQQRIANVSDPSWQDCALDNYWVANRNKLGSREQNVRIFPQHRVF